MRSSIGEKFGVNKHLEVVGFASKSASGKTVCIVHCSICAKDSELFGDGNFKILHASLKRGHVPCGCAPTHKLTEQQYRVKLSRIFKERNYKLLSVGEFKGSKTPIVIECLTDGHVWETSINPLMNDNGGCVKCCEQARRKPDDEMIDSFMASGVFVEGTRFWRSERKSAEGKIGYWNYTCPICSNDEYVEVGLCSGVFETRSNSLQIGSRSCRCSHGYEWSKPQREYQINKSIKDRGVPYKFVGWVDETTYRCKLSCGEHGEWEPNLGSFLSKESECPSCAQTGFDPSLPGSIYVLRIGTEQSGFTGYGISNVLSRRLATHRRSLADNGLLIEDSTVFNMLGRNARSIEVDIKSNFQRQPQDIEGFRTEATSYSNYNDVLKFVEDRVEGLAY